MIICYYISMYIYIYTYIYVYTYMYICILIHALGGSEVSMRLMIFGQFSKA